MVKMLKNTPLTVAIVQQLFDEQLKELIMEIHKMINENALDEVEAGNVIQPLGKNIGGVLPDQENRMAKLEEMDDEIERTAKQMPE